MRVGSWKVLQVSEAIYAYIYPIRLPKRLDFCPAKPFVIQSRSRKILLYCNRPFYMKTDLLHLVTLPCLEHP